MLKTPIVVIVALLSFVVFVTLIAATESLSAETQALAERQEAHTALCVELCLPLRSRLITTDCWCYTDRKNMTNMGSLEAPK